MVVRRLAEHLGGAVGRPRLCVVQRERDPRFATLVVGAHVKHAAVKDDEVALRRGHAIGVIDFLIADS